MVVGNPPSKAITKGGWYPGSSFGKSRLQIWEVRVTNLGSPGYKFGKSGLQIWEVPVTNLGSPGYKFGKSGLQLEEVWVTT